jgi:hypothetical protein
LLGGKDTRVIYRHYATLYFVFVVDESESELGILDLIQVSLFFHRKIYIIEREMRLLTYSYRYLSRVWIDASRMYVNWIW